MALEYVFQLGGCGECVIGRLKSMFQKGNSPLLQNISLTIGKLFQSCFLQRVRESFEAQSLACDGSRFQG